jgi:hypothetical protein
MGKKKVVPLFARLSYHTFIDSKNVQGKNHSAPVVNQGLTLTSIILQGGTMSSMKS